jgi:hypothetical protein
LPEEVIRFFYSGGRVKPFPAGRINAVGLALKLVSLIYPSQPIKKLLLSCYRVWGQVKGFGSIPPDRICAILSQNKGVEK